MSRDESQAPTDISLWMPLYIGDYQKDTMRLTTQQHGAYLLMLMEYWINGPLPDDNEDLAAITKMSLTEWKKHRKKLQRFFTVEGGSWHNKRADEEKEAATYRREVARKNGRKGGRPRKNNNPGKTYGFSNGGENETQEKPTGFNPVSKNGVFQNPKKSSSPSPSSKYSPYPEESDTQVSTGCVGGGDDLVDPSTGEVIAFGGAR